MASEDLVVRQGLVIPGEELRESTSRAGGPGGQHVNKTSTKVTLRWSVRDSAVLGDVWRERLLRKLASRLTREGELFVQAESSRSLSANRDEARVRLAEIVRAALAVPKARRKTKPTRGSKRRRVDAKKRRSEVKDKRRRPTGDD